MKENLSIDQKWRLILGPGADPEGSESLDEDGQKIDRALSLVYDETNNDALRRSRVKLNEWLRDIREYFPPEKTFFLQKEAIERLRINQLLFEQETFEQLIPDIELIKTILNLKAQIPEERLDDVKLMIRRYAEEVEKTIQWEIQNALFQHFSKGELSFHPPKKYVDWNKTIKRNLKNYQESLETILIKKYYGHAMKSSGFPEIFIVVDSSASMSDSVIYSAIIGSILAQIHTIKTTLILFDTDIADLSDQLDDVVDLLFHIELGGGTDINKVLKYVKSKIQTPADSYVFLITDLFDNYSDRAVYNTVSELRADHVTIHCILSMDEKGSTSYNKALAQHLLKLDIPCYTSHPNQFSEVLATALQKTTFSN